MGENGGEFSTVLESGPMTTSQPETSEATATPRAGSGAGGRTPSAFVKAR